jgi:hypothetical protein
MTELLDKPSAIPHDEPFVPELQNGDHLSREEFHRRYEAMGESTRAELIEGIVYLYSSGMPCPVSIDKHSAPHADLIGWIYSYRMKTPGLVYGTDGSIFVDLDNEPQPDVLLGIHERRGGQTRLIKQGKKQYVANAPELVGEVAASTASIDLNAKLRAYQRNGVREYIVVLTEQEPAEVRWMTLEGGRFVAQQPEDGLFKSRVFPGLWLDPAALLAGDLPKLAAAVEAGCATDGHVVFVQRLADAG